MTIKLDETARAKLSKEQLNAIDHMSTTDETAFILMLKGLKGEDLSRYVADSLTAYREHDEQAASELMFLIDVHANMKDMGYGEEIALILNHYAVGLYNDMKPGSDESIKMQRDLHDREMKLIDVIEGND